MDPALYERARKRASELGLVTFSAYVCQLIRSDLHAGGAMTVVQDAPSAHAVPPRSEVVYGKLPLGRRKQAALNIATEERGLHDVAECVPEKMNAGSSSTVPPSTLPQTATAKIVKLPKLHLGSPASTSAPSKTKPA